MAFEDFCEQGQGIILQHGNYDILSLVVETARLGRNFHLMTRKWPGIFFGYPLCHVLLTFRFALYLQFELFWCLVSTPRQGPCLVNHSLTVHFPFPSLPFFTFLYFFYFLFFLYPGNRKLQSRLQQGNSFSEVLFLKLGCCPVLKFRMPTLKTSFSFKYNLKFINSISPLSYQHYSLATFLPLYLLDLFMQWPSWNNVYKEKSSQTNLAFGVFFVCLFDSVSCPYTEA